MPGDGSDAGLDLPDGPATIDPARLGLLSLTAFGNELQWKELLTYNDIDDPLRFSGPLAVPPSGEGP